MFRRLRTRAILLVGLVALLPLVILGALAIHRARRTLLEEASISNLDLARRAAIEIEVHVIKYRDTMRRLAQTFSPATRLATDQVARILKNYRFDVRDLKELDYVGEDGREIATA